MAPISQDLYNRKVEILLAATAAENSKGEAHLKLGIRRPRRLNHPTPQETSETDRRPLHTPSYYNGPTQCLFDNSNFQDVHSNVEYMRRTFSFFIPNREYLKDLNGLIQYLGHKVYYNCQCLACHRVFRCADAAKMHMISKGHTRIGTHTEDLEAEIEDFYDFQDSYKELFALRNQPLEPDFDASGDDEWEDVGETKEDSSQVELSTLLKGFGLRKARITSMGDLKLPDGRRLGHRDLAYVYKQRLGYQRKPFQRAALKAEAEQDTSDKDSEIEKIDMAAQHDYRRKFQRSFMRLGVKANALINYRRP